MTVPSSSMERMLVKRCPARVSMTMGYHESLVTKSGSRPSRQHQHPNQRITLGLIISIGIVTPLPITANSLSPRTVISRGFNDRDDVGCNIAALLAMQGHLFASNYNDRSWRAYNSKAIGSANLRACFATCREGCLRLLIR